MNADDRKELTSILEDFNTLLDRVGDMLEAVQDRAENLLEYFPNSVHYEKLQEESEALNDVWDEMDANISELQGLVG